MTTASLWRLSPTCRMCLGDVDHEKVGYVAEVPDELLELVKSEHERGSGATTETQHQRSAVCRENTARHVGPTGTHWAKA